MDGLATRAVVIRNVRSAGENGKITLTSWILSSLLNLLLLCLLTLLPQRLRIPPEIGLPIELVSVQNQPAQ